MSGNLPFPCYSRLKTFLTRPVIHVIYYEAWHSTSLVSQFNSLITKETKWKLNHFSQTLLFTVTLKNCSWSFEIMVKIQIHYMCGSMWWSATSLHTLYLRPLPIRECSVPLEHHSCSCWRWRYLFLEAVVELRRKGYAMESDVVENDLDKGDKQLFNYLELRHTERSCWCIQQKSTQPCCSNTERHMNEARTSSER